MIEWSSLVPSGHRSLTSKSSILRKSVDSMFLVSSDEKYINLYEDSDMIKEDHRIVLICGTVGYFSGNRYDVHAGYIQTSSRNAEGWFSNDDPCERAKLIIYQDFHIVVTFTANEDQKPKTYKFSVQHLFDLVNLSALVSLSTVEFGDDNIQSQIKDETERELTLAEKRQRARDEMNGISS